MLGEDLVGDEDAVATEFAVRDDPLVLAEEVRHHTRISHRDIALEVRDHELHIQAPRSPSDRSRPDHATQAEAFVERRSPGSHLAWIEEEHDVVLERSGRQQRRQRDTTQDADHQRDPPLPGCHDASPSASVERRRRASSSAS